MATAIYLFSALSNSYFRCTYGAYFLSYSCRLVHAQERKNQQIFHPLTLLFKGTGYRVVRRTFFVLAVCRSARQNKNYIR